MVEHQAKLPRLFKRYQIQPVWRADRPARGRFREFYQCDVDSLGSTSPVIEAELCVAVADAMTELGFNDFVIRINHRQLLTALLEVSGVDVSLHTTVLIVLDKLDKVGPESVRAELISRGVRDSVCDSLLKTFPGQGRHLPSFSDGVLQRFFDLLGENPKALAALRNLRTIKELVGGTSADKRLTLDVSLARGLSYYTGAIMEINVADLAGSLGGGGRYDNLIGMFSGQDIPACGFSLGLERILVVMTERGMFPPTVAASPADVMLAMFDASAAGDAMRVADVLRASGLRVLVCGLNPSLHAADAGVGYAGPSNRFWSAAVDAGLVARRLDPWDALRRGVGMTDLVKRATPRAGDVSAVEFREGAARV